MGPPRPEPLEGYIQCWFTYVDMLGFGAFVVGNREPAAAAQAVHDIRCVIAEALSGPSGRRATRGGQTTRPRGPGSVELAVG
jgi:hypothetical protein